MRVLVCGGRNWAWCRWDAEPVEKRRALLQRKQTFWVLDQIDMIIGVDVIIHGDARGADRASGAWADSRRVTVEPYPADWKLHGRAAGPIRNSQMLDEGWPDLGVAFPGGVGTSDMVGKLLDAEKPVLDLEGLLERSRIIYEDGVWRQTTG